MIAIAFSICLFCVFTIVLLNNYSNKLKNKRYYELLQQFPSYPKYPLIGNLYMICSCLNDILGKMEDLMVPYDRLLFWLGPMPTIFLKKYDDIMAVSTQSHYRDTLDFAHDWFGTGLVTAKYEEWKKSRKILAPAFSSEMLTKYIEVFKKKSAALVRSFESAANNGQIIDVIDHVMKSNLEGIVENTIDISIEDRKEEGKIFGDAVEKSLREMTKRYITFWLYPDFMYKIYLKVTQKKYVINQLHGLPTKVLKEKLVDFHDKSDTFGDVTSSKALIDLLIKGASRESSFTEKRMRDELLHIIVTGIESTILNTSFLMLQLAMNQDVQQKVYEEIMEIFDENDTLTADHLFNRFKYLEQCIKETSRLYSSAILTTRRTHKECLLKDNVIIPANTFVIEFLHLANNDPELYENPQKWNPEHFSKESIDKRPKDSFASFGFGPRSCIGIRYGILSIKTQIVHILQNYHLSTNISELKRDQLTADLCVRSKIGYPIKFTKRQANVKQL